MIQTIPYVAAAIAGAVFAGRNAPRTKLKKLQCLGPRSGVIYDIDLVPNLGMVIVHAPNGSCAVFQAKPPPATGFVFVRGQGPPDTIVAMKRDIES